VGTSVTVPQAHPLPPAAALRQSILRHEYAHAVAELKHRSKGLPRPPLATPRRRGWAPGRHDAILVRGAAYASSLTSIAPSKPSRGPTSSRTRDNAAHQRRPSSDAPSPLVLRSPGARAASCADARRMLQALTLGQC